MHKRNNNTMKKHTKHGRRAMIESLEARELLTATVTTASDTFSIGQGGARSALAVASVGKLSATGSHLYDHGGMTDAGIVWLRDPATGTTKTYTKPWAAPGDYFGQALAGTDDGFLYVGAYGDDTGASNAGAVYVINTVTNAITRIANPTPATNDQFGMAVAAVGTNILIGARGDDTRGTDAGAAYLFSRTGVLLATYYSPSAHGSAFFGHAVAAAGNDVLIGAHYDNRGGHLRNGAVYRYDGAFRGELANAKAVFSNPTPAADDRFGATMASDGTYVLITADGDDVAATNGGAVHVYKAYDNTFVRTITKPGAAYGDAFGNSLAARNGRAVIGCQADDYGASNSGAAYVFDLGSGTMTHQIFNPTIGMNDQFGSSVTILSDGSVVVGASGDDTLATDAGSTYRFVI